MNMTGMDGFELAEEIKEYTPTLPIIIVNSLGQSTSDEAEETVTATVIKPLKPWQVYNALQVIFGGEVETTQHPTSSPRSKFDKSLGLEHPLRILLGEDNVGNQLLIQHMLKRLSYRADIAANGLEVLESLQRQTYDVVLMDVQMPEMDGLETTRHIINEWGAEDRPYIIALTANAMPEDRQECLDAGMNEYISKPIQVKELVQALTNTPTRVKPPENIVETAVSLAPSDPGSILDQAALDNMFKLVDGDTEFLVELINTVLEDAPKLLADMREGAVRKDAEKLHIAAHSLKSNSADFGALRLAELCRKLENNAKVGNLDNTIGLVTTAVKEYELVKAALKQIRDESGR